MTPTFCRAKVPLRLMLIPETAHASNAISKLGFQVDDVKRRRAERSARRRSRGGKSVRPLLDPNAHVRDGNIDLPRSLPDRDRVAQSEYLVRVTSNAGLVQFRAYLGSRSSHIGSHIVEFYNVRTAELALGRLFVWENGDEEMGPVSGLLC